MKQLVEVAGLIIGLATIGLLVRNSEGVKTIVSATGQSFSGVLNTATFQSNAFSPNF